MKKNVAVLMGGFSSEKEISLKSGEAIYQNINRSKFENITGIGKKIVEKIYKRFQSTNEMKDLSENELSYKLGVSKKIAKEIKKIS